MMITNHAVARVLNQINSLADYVLARNTQGLRLNIHTFWLMEIIGSGFECIFFFLN